MQRFFFNFFDDHDEIDLTGFELPDASAARDHATELLRMKMSEQVQRGRINPEGRVEVIDEAGTLQFTVVASAGTSASTDPRVVAS